jgi:xylulokinase
MRGVAGQDGVRRVVATGGGTRNPLLLSLKASLFGLPVEVCDMPEGTCLGAALLGGLAAGLYRDLDEARANLDLAWRRVEPDPAWPEAARRRRLGAYAETYRRLRDLHAVLRESG